MRRTLLAALVSVILVIGFLVHSLSTLISLLTEDATANAIHRADLPAANISSPFSRPELIPQLIHQTYANDSIPERWRLAQKSCKDLHPEYKYILWTDLKARNFIEREYPWFLPTFDGYSHPIQRADTIRYFVLSHYGGIYIDLDQGCKRRLDPLLSYPAWLRRTIPTGISNDVMGSAPQHPFFLHVIKSLEAADRKWILPYITIMATTGPLFLSVMWKEWMDEYAGLEQENWPGRVHVLTPDLAEKHPWSFFESYGGSSWHGQDAKLILWMGQGKNWMLIAAGGFVFGTTLGLGLWQCCRWIGLAGTKMKRDRRRRSEEGPTARDVRPQRSPFWMRLRRAEGREEIKRDYELVEQHIE